MSIPRLLIIENNHNIRDLLVSLYSAQYVLRFASGLDTAITECPGFDPDLVIFDMEVPDLDTMQHWRHVREARDCQISAIVIVSENRLEVERFVREKGVFYYLVRPFDMSELSEAIESALAYGARQKSKLEV